MPWLIGIAVLGVLGYIAVKRVTGAVGQSVVNALGAGTISGITTITIGAGTTSGSMGSVSVQQGDSLVLNVYAPPAGYVWKFDGGGVLTLASATATSATFTAPKTGPASGTVYVNLVKAGATVAPATTYSIALTVS
jgi:hypothetical protein